MSTAEAKTESLYGHESTTLNLSLSAQTSDAKKMKLERLCFKDLDGYVVTFVDFKLLCIVHCYIFNQSIIPLLKLEYFKMLNPLLFAEQKKIIGQLVHE